MAGLRDVRGLGSVGRHRQYRVLVFAARFMPVLGAKGCAILAGFLVNFSMSHFVVFRARPRAAAAEIGAAGE